MFDIQTDPRGVRELLIDLVENYKFELNFLSKCTGVELNSLEKLYNGQTDLLELALPIEQMSKLMNTLSMLSTDISVVEDDDRVQGVIKYLTIQGLNLNLETIAIYAGISIEDLENFMKDTNSISYEKRYKLATKCLYLHFLFKEISQSK
ncbi:HTH domain-containing protein [Clostridium saccharoperbutylacetonicum]|uniref:HTH domain-containing protein n=1 Tax=Clostridium saccharoperbutylacetonicum TaxID=36745 RepID=UPI0039E7ACAC